jgi:hypothetical protein
MPDNRSTVFAGAVTLPVVVTVLLFALGYDVGDFGHRARLTAAYLLGLATAGGVAAYAMLRGRAGHRAHFAVAGCILGYAVLAPIDPLFAPAPWAGSRILEFTSDAIVLGLCSVLVVAAVEAATSPGSAAAVVPPDARRLVLAAAVGHAVAAVVVRTGVFGFPAFGRSLFGVAMGCWLVGGAAIEGGVPALAYARFRLVSPALALVGLFGWTARETWLMVTDSAALAVSATPFTAFLLGWFVVVLLLGGVGLVEYGGRAVVAGR